MAVCASCGTNNIDGTKFCVGCGAQLADAPAPESWRASGDLGSTPGASATGPSDAGGASGGANTGYTPGADAGYTPGSTAGGYAPPPPPSSFPTYTPTQSPQGYQPQGGAQPMHPAIPAIVSFMLPGIGLLFVPNKQKLGLMVFGGWIALIFLMMILAFVTLGLGACLFPLLILANVAAGIHSWDEAAKSSGGQFKPILFK